MLVTEKNYVFRFMFSFMQQLKAKLFNTFKNVTLNNKIIVSDTP